MSELSGPERREIREALMSAVINQDEWEIILYDYDFNHSYLDIIKNKKLYTNILQDLITKAESRGELKKLIDNVYNYNSGNENLQIIYRQYVQSPTDEPENGSTPPNHEQKPIEPQDPPDQLTQQLNPEKYKLLNYLLENQRWVEANEETFAIMNQVPGTSKYSWKASDIQNCPCDVLCHIDKLWQQYSNNCFGFTVQKKIWEEKCTNLNDPEKEFGRHVGWYDNWRKQWLSRSKQMFTDNLEKNLDDQEKYQGIIPTLTLKNTSLEVNARLIPHLVEKLESCNCD
ncbi:MULTISPECIES: GUN4 domain-containing protein [unclassified Moorena]|uniref:GUN4 domain-containing protein n=1 Tax=unclassified Moorena TaxID=2683338 RepID=UPI0013BC45CA|nr:MULTISPECIES: GUN4 domain-containing protein [unclassified Moorena]NEP35643.1 hypothetical protein [Moorena sp. SIO3B2]NEQ09101.1 hypothetical protein [Moorena sp. SIO4E2]NES45476.1 hypothetical protein [Moorena sp. SIO2C4]